MRPNLPRYVQVVRAKGTDYLYFRRHGQRWPLPDDPTSLEFRKAYLELLGKTELDPEPLSTVDSSVAALICDYRCSEEFLSLTKKTQRDYGRMLGQHSVSTAGESIALREWIWRTQQL